MTNRPMNRDTAKRTTRKQIDRHNEGWSRDDKAFADKHRVPLFLVRYARRQGIPVERVVAIRRQIGEGRKVPIGKRVR